MKNIILETLHDKLSYINKVLEYSTDDNSTTLLFKREKGQIENIINRLEISDIDLFANTPQTSQDRF